MPLEVGSMEKPQDVQELVLQLPTMERPELADLWEVYSVNKPEKRLRPELGSVVVVA
jgi:hypothetical protein